MKKSLIAVVIAVVVIGVIGAAGAVYAQAPDPGTWIPGQGFGNRDQMRNEDGSGIYHEEMMTIFSEAFGISIEDLQTRIEGGETLMQIALAEGLSFEEVKDLLPAGVLEMRTMRAQNGRGFMHNNADGEFMPGPRGDGTCLQDGEYAPQFMGPRHGQGMSRGSGGRN